MKLLEDMQSEAKRRTPGRNSLRGADGMPYTETIQCVKKTVQSWSILSRRREFISEGSSAKIHAPSVTSEKNVEHTFGFYKKKGQGHNEAQEEYIIS